MEGVARGERRVEVYLLIFERALDAAARRDRERSGRAGGLAPLGGGWTFRVACSSSRGVVDGWEMLGSEGRRVGAQFVRVT